MKILCLTKNFKTQTPSGGYDQLAKFIGAQTVSRPVISSFPMRLTEKLWNFGFGDKPHLFSHLSHGYRFEDRVCEERAFWRAVLQRPDIVHVLYGDWALDTLLRRKELLTSEVVATFHLPADSVANRFEHAQKSLLEILGGAILLSSSDLATYSAWLGPQKVMYIPHGIDTDVFRPAEFTPNRAVRFVFIGMMLRDFEVAHRVIDQCRQDCINAEFIIVIPQVGMHYFTGCTNAQIVSNLSETELIRLYQSSDALFLPLIHSSANNAILEALACGLPVISTRIGGVPDYVDETCGWLLPPAEFEAAYECVRSIVRNQERTWVKRKAARLKAESFSWEKVIPPLLEAYVRLRKTGRFAPDPQEPATYGSVKRLGISNTSSAATQR